MCMYYYFNERPQFIYIHLLPCIYSFTCTLLIVCEEGISLGYFVLSPLVIEEYTLLASLSGLFLRIKE